jgi:hypothetical protein
MTISNNYPTIAPSLNLDFVNSQVLDPRISSTRSTTATYYDGKTNAIAEQNLFLQSQNLSNGAWVSTNNSIATGITDPFGGTTAQTLTASAGNSTFYQTVTLTATAYTVSFYVQRVTGTGAINFTLDGTNFTAITAPTGSWVRYYITATPSSGNKTVGIQIVTSGDAINIAFGQLENRSVATAYNATTTPQLTNYIPVLQNAGSTIPRLDYNPVTGQPNGLMLEPQSSNLLTYSSLFSNAAWTPTNASLVANAAIAPDGLQTASAFILVPTTSSAFTNLAVTITSSATAYAFSWFVKYEGIQFIQLSFASGLTTNYTNFDLINGTVTGGTYTSASIISVGDGVYRIVTVNSFAATTAACYISPISSGSAARASSYAGNGYSGIYIWGAQLENQNFFTSYIATSGSQVTRSAEACYVNSVNFSSLFNQGQGTLYSDYLYKNTEYITRAPFLAVSTNPNSISDSQIISANYYGNTGQNTTFMNPIYGTNALASPSIAYTPSTTNPTGLALKAAIAYQSGNSAGALNGTISYSDSTKGQNGSIGLTCTSLYFNENGAHFNGYIRKIAYYPERLSNTQIQSLTGS